MWSRCGPTEPRSASLKALYRDARVTHYTIEEEEKEGEVLRRNPAPLRATLWVQQSAPIYGVRFLVRTLFFV